MPTAVELTASGKVIAVREGLVIFSPAGTSYEMQLVCPGYAGPVNVPVQGIIRAKARKVYTVPSGGLFVTPIFGPPRIIQGRIRVLDEKSMVLHAGGSITVDFPDDDDAFDLVNGPLTMGRLANVVVFPGATFELRK
ncbi:MAG TPA: hypothetical protein VFE47_27855 [Tepidisphaeraceae bacterium]|jgi:hypothetical protein|nr:hypothetical protein [Tepidisphaeraceae bacterium]